MRRIAPRSALPGQRGGTGGGAQRAAVFLSAIVLAFAGRPAFAKRDDGPPSPAEKQYQQPVSTRLNTTGRVIKMPVPLKDDATELGELVVVINPDDSVVLPKAALVDKLTPVLDKAALERLHGIPDANGQVTIGDLAAAGFNIRFDPAALALVFLPAVDERPVGDISLARARGPLSSASAVKPALIGGYLNVFTGLDYLWGDASGSQDTNARFDFEGVMRMWDVVVENEFTVEGAVEPTVCPTDAECADAHMSGLKRRRSRLVYDLPDQEIRVQAGDADVYGAGLQRAPDILGVTVEKSPRKLRPGENIRATGKSSFRIERPSDVEVLVNGAISQKLRLRAGNYNLSDLPLATGANEVQLIITDDTGERRSLAFTTFFDGNLLGEGKHEWSLSGGVASSFEDNERQYETDAYFASGFARYGISDAATGEVHLQGDRDVIMGGLGVFAATPWGLLGVQGALSDSPSGLGYTAEIAYDLVNFQGPISILTGLHETLRLGAEYRSAKFSAPGAYVTAAGAEEPETDYTLRFSAAYAMPLPKGISMSLGARYQIEDDNAGTYSLGTNAGDRYALDLTLSSVLSERATGSITFGYSNESYLATDTEGGADGAYQVLARVFFRPDEETHVSASYDTLNRQTSASGSRAFGEGIDAWATAIDVEHNGDDENGAVSGAVAYFGNRAEISAEHNAGFDNVGFSASGVEASDQRTSLRIGTAVAFADGKFGIGQPIRGNGFAVVYPHENIGDKTVTVGTSDDVRARADWLGPAVVPDVPAYTNNTIPVDVADLPVGYSLGSGGFDTFAPYKGAYRLEVGSDYSVSAYGTLLTAEDEPVALLTGIAYPEGNKGKQVAIFTNGAGKFGAEGLAPGKWIIEMATDGAPTLFALEIPDGTDGLIKIGELKPMAGG